MVLLKYVFRDIHDLVVVNVGEGQSGIAEVVFDVELIAPGGAIGRDAPFGVVDGIHGEGACCACAAVFQPSRQVVLRINHAAAYILDRLAQFGACLVVEHVYGLAGAIIEFGGQGQEHQARGK